jgi:hypothetical protein
MRLYDTVMPSTSLLDEVKKRLPEEIGAELEPENTQENPSMKELTKRAVNPSHKANQFYKD